MVFAILVSSVLFTSNTTLEQSNQEMITQLSSELADLKQELKSVEVVMDEKDLAVFDPFVGQVAMFAGNFAPEGWAFCDGQQLAISSNTSLFSLLGTTYGGDGRTTFGLPNMQELSKANGVKYIIALRGIYPSRQ